MQNLRKVKNYHFGMGLLLLLGQVIFQISDAFYFFGLLFILFSIYEASILKKLVLQKGKMEKTREILTQFKWFNFFAIIPILLITAKLVSDFMSYESISALMFGRPLLCVNLLIISGIIMHFSMKSHIRKIEEDIIGV